MALRICLFTLRLNAHPMHTDALDVHWHLMRVETSFVQATSGGGFKVD